MVKLAYPFSAFAAALAFAASSHAHSELSTEQLMKRDAFQQITGRAYHETCRPKLRARDHYSRAAERRADFARRMRESRGVALDLPYRMTKKRQLPSVEESHYSNQTGLTVDSDPFIDESSGCILDPETTQGPYLVNGELIRQNLTEGEEGIPIYLDVQVIDVETCLAASNVYIDMWHANATGVYSGVVSTGNGNGPADQSNLNNTFLRGIQKTTEEGYAQFISVFPGHYAGRAVHIHLMTHDADGILECNGTYLNSTMSHVGQIYFDQSLINSTSNSAPYSANNQSLVLNDDDWWLAQVWNEQDPLASYVYLNGQDLSDGLLIWTTLIVNQSIAYDPSPAAWYTGNGGVVNPDSEFGGGFMPTGSVSSGPVPYPSA